MGDPINGPHGEHINFYFCLGQRVVFGFQTMPFSFLEFSLYVGLARFYVLKLDEERYTLPHCSFCNSYSPVCNLS